jgi:hypothetical protein
MWPSSVFIGVGRPLLQLMNMMELVLLTRIGKQKTKLLSVREALLKMVKILEKILI